MNPVDSTVDRLLHELAGQPLLDPPTHVVHQWQAALARLNPPVTSAEGTDGVAGMGAPAVGGRTGGLLATTRRRGVLGRGVAGGRALGGGALGRGTLGRRALGRTAAVLASAAAVWAISVAVGAGAPATPAPRPDGQVPPPALSDSSSVGGLADPATRAGCLAHVGVPAGEVLLAKRVGWHGRAGVQLVLTTPELGRFRTVTVSPDCDRNAGQLLDDTRDR